MSFEKLLVQGECVGVRACFLSLLGMWNSRDFVVVVFFLFVELTHEQLISLSDLGEKKIRIELMSFFWDKQFLLATKNETERAGEQASERG